jgi:hypothetical protein
MLVEGVVRMTFYFDEGEGDPSYSDPFYHEIPYGIHRSPVSLCRFYIVLYLVKGVYE